MVVGVNGQYLINSKVTPPRPPPPSLLALTRAVVAGEPLLCCVGQN